MARPSSWPVPILSHYHPYDEAKELDSRCVKAICDLNIDEMKTQEACGKLPILTLMYLAREKGWKAQLLDYRNSGDTSGDKSRVVGYAAVAFYEPAPENVEAKSESFCSTSPADPGRAWRPIRNAAGSQHQGPVAEIIGDQSMFRDADGKRRVARLHRAHLPQEALYQAVVDNARNAATRDPRFPPVRPDELKKIKIEISVLTEPQPLRSVRRRTSSTNCDLTKTAWCCRSARAGPRFCRRSGSNCRTRSNSSTNLLKKPAARRTTGAVKM